MTKTMTKTKTKRARMPMNKHKYKKRTQRVWNMRGCFNKGCTQKIRGKKYFQKGGCGCGQQMGGGTGITLSPAPFVNQSWSPNSIKTWPGVQPGIGTGNWLSHNPNNLDIPAMAIQERAGQIFPRQMGGNPGTMIKIIKKMKRKFRTPGIFGGKKTRHNKNKNKINEFAEVIHLKRTPNESIFKESIKTNSPSGSTKMNEIIKKLATSKNPGIHGGAFSDITNIGRSLGYGVNSAYHTLIGSPSMPVNPMPTAGQFAKR